MYKKRNINNATEKLHVALNYMEITTKKLVDVVNMLKNPFDTLPKEAYINVIITQCDSEMNSVRSYNEEIYFEREISTAFLYIELKDIAKRYFKDYRLSVSLQDIENWLIQMKALAFTADLKHDGFIPEAGLTIATIKRKEGQDDIFIEYAFII